MSQTALVTDSRAVLRKHARSFHLAGLFLPSGRRDRAAVLYAFCRLVDDTADEATDLDEARAGLAALRAELVGDVEPRPLVAATRTLLEDGGVGLGPAIHLLDGVEGDLDPVRVADDGELLRYCYRVAGTVGLMMCAVLGVTDRRAHAFAIDLGVGMQLTNICRDVREDAERGRVYLPADRLRRAGSSHRVILEGTAGPLGVASVVGDLLDLADRYYESADAGMRFIPARSRVAILVASRVYRAIGTVLRRHDCDSLAGRVWTSPLDKAVAIAGALVATVRVSLPAMPTHDRGLHQPLAGLPGTEVS